MTAHYLVTSSYPVREGDIAVVHAAAGGVGLLLTQMVKRRGGIVVATTSGGEKAELARGRAPTTSPATTTSAPSSTSVTDGAGAHVVYDGVGQATFDDGLAALRPRGMMVLYGAASGQVPPVDPQRLNSGGSLFLTRPTLVHYIADARNCGGGPARSSRGSPTASSMCGSAAPTRWPTPRRAQEDLAARRTTGKLLSCTGL